MSNTESTLITQGRSMEITYTNTKGDLIAFNEHHLANNQDYQKRKVMSLYVSPLFLLLAFSLLAFTSEEDIYYIGGTIGALVSYLWSFFAYKRYAKKCAEVNQKEVFCEHKITISDSGISESTENSSSQCTWQALEKIDGNENYIFIYNTPLTAFVIPKREIGEEAFNAAKAALNDFSLTNKSAPSD